MCGVAGYYCSGNKNIKTILKDMNKCLTHRGPDCSDIKYFQSETYSLGLSHNRLSIIDLSAYANQPMCNNDQTLWITYNGEIYNYKEIASILRSKGYIFRTNSDTEVILYGFEEWGVECLERLNGMFAFAIWDTQKRQMFLARDRLGIKPLYYYHHDNIFAFSSEISALKSSLPGSLTIDNTALAFYTTIGYISAPYSIYEKIRTLEPGHYLLFVESRLMNKQYWDVDFFNKEKRSYAHLLKTIPQKLSDAVSRQMVSDVPVGAFLSGGIDSSAVVAMMNPATEEVVETFSIGFKEKAYDESMYARQVAHHLGTKHHEFFVKPDALSILPKLVKHFGEPFSDSSALPTYYVSEEARKHVKVVLSGDGGDELFCGYTINLGHKISELFNLIPLSLRKIICRAFNKISFSENNESNRILGIFQKRFEDASLKKMERIFSKSCKFTKDFRNDLLSEVSIDPVVDFFEKLLNHGTADDFLDHIAYLQVKMSLPSDMLTKVDRMSMANSLEVRVPLLDHEFVEYIAKIPVQQRFRFWKTKWLLRKAMEPYIPKDILWRKKQGFSTPLYYWFGSQHETESSNNITRYSSLNANDMWGRMFFDEWKNQLN